MKRAPTGRPPRTDDPIRLCIRLPGESLRRWLAKRAAIEDRYEGDVIATALEAYRRRVPKKEGRVASDSVIALAGAAVGAAISIAGGLMRDAVGRGERKRGSSAQD